MREKREEYNNIRKKKFLLELLELLEAECEKADDGNSIDKDKLMDIISAKAKEFTGKLANKELRVFDRSILPVNGIFSENGNVRLKVIESNEKEKYMKVSEQCSISKTVFEQVKDFLWQDFLSDNMFVCSIYDSNTNDYVGYCSIKELDSLEWEIAIELLEEYRNKKYGTAALNMFMDKLTELTGNRFYKYLVDIDNKPSQKLIRRVGGYPDDITEFTLYGDDLERFREENLDMINDDIREVAEEFCSAPEALIGMVLQYRVDRKRNF